MKNRLAENLLAERVRAHGNGFARGLWNCRGVFALASVALLFSACNVEERQAGVRDPGIPAAPGGTTVERVAEDPNRLLGQTVTVTGEVQEIFGPSTFQIEDKSIFCSDEVLVVNATGTAIPITEGKDMRVTGEVRKFVLAEFERDYDLGWDLDIKRKIEAEYRDKRVIVARSIPETKFNPGLPKKSRIM